MYRNSERHESVGAVLKNSFNLVRHSFLHTLPYAIILAIVLYVGHYLQMRLQDAVGHPSWWANTLFFAIDNLISLFFMGYLVLINDAIGKGQRPNISQITSRICQRYVSIVIAFIGVYILNAVGMALGMFPSFILSVYIVPLLALGFLFDDKPMDIIKHSFRISYLRWWQSFCVMFIPYVVTMICAIGSAKMNLEGMLFAVAYIFIISWLMTTVYCQTVNLLNRPISAEHSNYLDSFKSRPKALVTAAWLTAIYAILMTAVTVYIVTTSSAFMADFHASPMNHRMMDHLMAGALSSGMIVGLVVVFMIYAFYGSRTAQYLLVLFAALSALLYFGHFAEYLVDGMKGMNLAAVIVHLVSGLLNIAIIVYALKATHWIKETTEKYKSLTNKNLADKLQESESPS